MQYVNRQKAAQVCCSSAHVMTPLRPMHCVKSVWATRGSTADSGSSNSTMSLRAYAARASASRAFCPPDRLTPRSPISVASPAGSCAMSCARAQAATTVSYLQRMQYEFYFVLHQTACIADPHVAPWQLRQHCQKFRIKGKGGEQWKTRSTGTDDAEVHTTFGQKRRQR